MTNSESKRLQNYALYEKKSNNQDVMIVPAQNQQIYWRRFQTIFQQHTQWIEDQLSFFSKITEGNNLFDAEIDSLKFYKKIQDINAILMECSENISTRQRLTQIRKMININQKLFKNIENIVEKQLYMKQTIKETLWKKNQTPIFYGQVIFAIIVFLFNILCLQIWILSGMKQVLKYFIGTQQFNEMSTIYLLYNYIRTEFWIFPIMVFLISFGFRKLFNSISGRKKEKKKQLLQGFYKLWRKTQNTSSNLQLNISYNLSFFYIVAKYCGDSVCIVLTNILYLLMKEPDFWLGFIIVQKQWIQSSNQTNLFNNNSLALFSYDEYLCSV